MDPTFAFLSLYALTATAFLAAIRIANWRSDAARRRRAASALVSHFHTAGLQFGFVATRESAVRGPEWRGHLRDCDVSVEATPTGPDGWATKVTVRPASPLLSALYVQMRWWPAGSTLRDTELSGTADIRTGDGDFDRRLEAGGHTPTVRALLTSDVRQALVALARGGVVCVDPRGLAYEVFEQPRSAVDVVTLVHRVTAAAELFPRVSDVFAALADNASNDPQPGVRERCLATLLADAPEHPRTTGTLTGAFCDGNDAVRVVAAIALGERGLSVLREIAAQQTGEEEPPARAIAVLGRHLTPDETLAILDSALMCKRRVVAAAAVESLARTVDPAAYRRLAAVVQADDQLLAVIAVNALGEAGTSEAEQLLVEALSSCTQGLRRVVVRALGRTGSVATIARLRALMEGDAGAADLTSLVQQAIAEIQSRLTDATPGRLSLAEGDSGDLSLAEDDASGRLSLPHEPPPE